MNKKVKIGNREVDLSKAYPLTLGDARALKAQNVDVLNIGTLDIEQVIAFISYIGKKACPELTEDDVLSTPVNVLAEMATQFGDSDKLGEGDRDFLPSSTASAVSTDGASRKSPN